MLTHSHPSLKRALGPRLQHPAVLTLLERFGSPAQIRKAVRRRLVPLPRSKAPRMAQRLIEGIFAALDEQTVMIPGPGPSGRVDRPEPGHFTDGGAGPAQAVES